MDLKAKYAQLSEREQRLTQISVVVVVIGLFYWLVWSPLNGALDQQRKAVSAQKSLLSWVQQNANKAIQLRGSSNTRSFNGSLTQAVNQTAGVMKISISRMQPQGEELQVWVDEAEFNTVLNWLQALERMGITILDADFAQAGEPGLIKVRRLQLGKS